MTLKDLKPGMSARIETVGGRGALRQHFLDMGMIPGVKVTVIKYAPLGDPVELRLHGYELTLRLDDAGAITVTPIEDAREEEFSAPERKEMRNAGKRTAHPGLGEEGRFHPPRAVHRAHLRAEAGHWRPDRGRGLEGERRQHGQLLP